MYTTSILNPRADGNWDAITAKSGDRSCLYHGRKLVTGKHEYIRCRPDILKQGFLALVGGKSNEKVFGCVIDGGNDNDSRNGMRERKHFFTGWFRFSYACQTLLKV